jgi:hypothetical protein
MKLILVLLFFTFSINAETIEFNGNYAPAIQDSIGFTSGCIYSGKTSDKKLVTVYSKKSCDITNDKNKIYICNITDINSKPYQGTCEIKK